MMRFTDELDRVKWLDLDFMAFERVELLLDVFGATEKAKSNFVNEKAGFGL